ncbi:MAG: 2-hydroxyacyl-CoA dehydratase family protein [Gracilibacteraceae bacterium]|jgi:benzoyl-CoA reductase/2-hydroxyglutaryl-CoA dehydratase subunit BcrC/BadD/HgdB|nr:2-hydroxyacyl-CoA dehydratase family protein [Gracilibacteraceae bacterium]
MAEEKKVVKVKTTADKSTETSKKAHLLVRKYYHEAAQALQEGRPVAWLMASTLCEEMCRAMDVTPIYTENFGGTAAAMQGGIMLCEACEADGFSMGICGYARVGLGHSKLRQELGRVDPSWPNGGMADPDLIIGCSAGCEPRYKWYQAQRRYQQVPFLCPEILDTYPVGMDPDDLEDYYVELLVAEMYETKALMEKHLGKKMDMDKVAEYAEQSERTRNLYWKCDEIRRAVPGPMPVEDMLSCMPFGFFYTAFKESEDFFQELYDELAARVKNGVGVIPEEKLRILWGWGLPPWHYLRIFNYLESKGAVAVMQECYTNFCADDCSQYSDPFERIARYQIRCRNHGHKEANARHLGVDVSRMISYVEDYKCDGVIQHALVSCRQRTIGQIASAEIMKKYSTIPVMSFQSDLVDERTASQAEINQRLDAFLEVAAVEKERRQKAGLL